MKPKRVKTSHSIILKRTLIIWGILISVALLVLYVIFPMNFTASQQNIQNDILSMVESKISGTLADAHNLYMLILNDDTIRDAALELQAYRGNDNKYGEFADAFARLKLALDEISFSHEDLVYGIVYIGDDVHTLSSPETGQALAAYIGRTGKSKISLLRESAVNPDGSDNFLLKYPYFGEDGSLLGSLVFYIKADTMIALADSAVWTRPSRSRCPPR
ncbi:hypothetical protein FACS189492_1510 [Clostridia bacterium]|nr:hypothetical protein FACS189492_1510 [Clostridia bacterium]